MPCFRKPVGYIYTTEMMKATLMICCALKLYLDYLNTTEMLTSRLTACYALKLLINYAYSTEKIK